MIAPPGSDTEAPEATADGASSLPSRCARHADAPATVACTRCGDFACDACRGAPPHAALCAKCTELALRPQPPRTTQMVAALAISMMIWAPFPYVFWVATELLMGRAQSPPLAPAMGVLAVVGAILPLVPAAIAHALSRALGGIGWASATIRATYLAQASMLGLYVVMLLPLGPWTSWLVRLPFVGWALVIAIHARSHHRLSRPRAAAVGAVAGALLPVSFSVLEALRR